MFVYPDLSVCCCVHANGSSTFNIFVVNLSPIKINIPNPSFTTPHPPPITHHLSPTTYHPLPITHHPSPITHHHPGLVQSNQTYHLGALLTTSISGRLSTHLTIMSLYVCLDTLVAIVILGLIVRSSLCTIVVLHILVVLIV